jgi:hypothetical protein
MQRSRLVGAGNDRHPLVTRRLVAGLSLCATAPAVRLASPRPLGGTASRVGRTADGGVRAVWHGHQLLLKDTVLPDEPEFVWVHGRPSDHDPVLAPAIEPPRL